jgi:hypothetical protein
MAQVVECLISHCKALYSNPCTANKGRAMLLKPEAKVYHHGVISHQRRLLISHLKEISKKESTYSDSTSCPEEINSDSQACFQ